MRGERGDARATAIPRSRTSVRALRDPIHHCASHLPVAFFLAPPRSIAGIAIAARSPPTARRFRVPADYPPLQAAGGRFRDLAQGGLGVCRCSAATCRVPYILAAPRFVVHARRATRRPVGPAQPLGEVPAAGTPPKPSRSIHGCAKPASARASATLASRAPARRRHATVARTAPCPSRATQARKAEKVSRPGACCGLTRRKQWRQARVNARAGGRGWPQLAFWRRDGATAARARDATRARTARPHPPGARRRAAAARR